MRKTSHYGFKYGATEVELRRGHINKIIVGAITRYSAEEQAKGEPILRMTPLREITGKATVAAMSRALVIARKMDPHQACAARDKIIAEVL